MNNNNNKNKRTIIITITKIRTIKITTITQIGTKNIHNKKEQC